MIVNCKKINIDLPTYVCLGRYLASHIISENSEGWENNTEFGKKMVNSSRRNGTTNRKIHY